MKSNRQKKILEIVNRHHVETQDDLIAYLETEGYSVTQATISRDIRELRISKVLGENGKYHYTLPKQATDPLKKDLRHTYMDSVTSVACGGNIVVIKTHPGLAQAVAAGVDSMHLPEILGCVAGDDTIFAATQDEETAKRIAERFSAYVKSSY